jgi:endogenous inhibitor of DNA gyrase (YacG/DUF329 family)
MRQGVTLNEKVTAIMAEAGVGMQYYTVLCPVCGKETSLMVGKGEDLDQRVEIHLLELQEYHNPVDWIDHPEPEPRATNCEACGHPLGPYNPNDTSTWRTDNFCSARCKKANKKGGGRCR